ncbi:hypothetical protein CHUAL_005154 [Chamberlinius hualienensis]
MVVTVGDMTVTTDSQSEKATFVHREVIPAYCNAGKDVEGKIECQSIDNLSEDLNYDADQPITSQYHQEAMVQAGQGFCQWLLLLVVGVALSVDLAEILSIVFLVPSAGQELCLSNGDRTWLGVVVLFGMLVGSALWGLLGDCMGRRKALWSAVLTNAIFSIIAAFMPNYNLLVITRFVSSCGAGGIVPTALVYYSEFLDREHRGPKLACLGMLWSLGGVFVALMAWAIIPRTGLVLMWEKQQYFCSWRIFSLLCSCPAVLSALSLNFVPESPRYLLEVGREVEALLVYKWVGRLNRLTQQEIDVEQRTNMELPTHRQLLGLYFAGPNSRSLVTGTLKGLDKFRKSMSLLCQPPANRSAGILAVLWSSTAFCYYGLSLWLSDHVQRVEESFYRSEANVRRDDFIQQIIFNVSIENMRFVNCFFVQVVFTDLVLNHVTFVNSTFSNCVFNNTRSSRTRFVGCDFRRTVFLDTDFGPDRFDGNCLTYNCTFLSTIINCPLDFDINFRLVTVFVQVLCIHLVILPATAITSFCIDRLGRVKLIGMALTLTCICTSFIWTLQTQKAILAFEAIINFLFVVTWSTMQVVTTELYSTNVRTTGFGLQVALSRGAGLLGCILFGVVAIDGEKKIAPIAMTVGSLLIGVVASVKLPNTIEALL